MQHLKQPEHQSEITQSWAGIQATSAWTKLSKERCSTWKYHGWDTFRIPGPDWIGFNTLPVDMSHKESSANHRQKGLKILWKLLRFFPQTRLPKDSYDTCKNTWFVPIF